MVEVADTVRQRSLPDSPSHWLPKGSGSPRDSDWDEKYPSPSIANTKGAPRVTALRSNIHVWRDPLVALHSVQRTQHHF